MKIVAMRGRPNNKGSNSQQFEFRKDNCTNTLTSVQKDNLVIEQQILRPERTEYGKQVRKLYESGVIREQRKNMMCLEPRTDGISNTLTTVQKDNLLLESKVAHLGNVNPSEHGINEDAVVSNAVEKFRVRKLTQKECWRLMGFEDEDFEKAKKQMNDNVYKGKDRSGSQLYKQAGNSIVVDVLLHIMTELYDVMPHLFEDIKIGSFFSGIGAFEKALERLNSDDNLPNDECYNNTELRQLGYINKNNGTANRIYDGGGLPVPSKPTPVAVAGKLVGIKLPQRLKRIQYV